MAIYLLQPRPEATKDHAGDRARVQWVGRFTIQAEVKHLIILV